ncbi:SpoIIE family protein phosphatase [Parasalinivibrio latis]|uniref:SpoIIE family protein phosphatase n=1 Tax=Parasalinivibrio latis TaxID=2952610 RepID=UPI0030DF3859
MDNNVLFEHRLPASLKSVRTLRNLLAKTITPCVSSELTRRKMLLCFAEAANNLVEHSQPLPSWLCFRFGKNASEYWIEIIDDGGKWDPTQFDESDISFFQEKESGRGIALLKQQCDSVSYSPGDKNQPNILTLSWSNPLLPKSGNILIVEDDPTQRRLYKAYLQNSYTVILASDGYEALDLLKRHHVDLVISDIRMPGMDGLTLREQIAQDPSTNLIPFVFISLNKSTFAQETASGMGVDDYLCKPVCKDTLMLTVKRVLGRSRQVYIQMTNRLNEQICNALQPQVPPAVDGWNLALSTRNTGIGGGDLLFYRKIGEQNLLTLADIMGHDEGAKFFSYAYGGYLRGLLQTAEPHPNLTSHILQRLSDSIWTDNVLSQVTLTCCAISLHPNGQFSVASAGHPSPLYIFEKTTSPVPVGGILAGLIPSTKYQSYSQEIRPGQRLAFFTDGLFESADSEQERCELEECIKTALVSTLHLPIEQALNEVMRQFDHVAGIPPKDDTLLLLIEREKSAI